MSADDIYHILCKGRLNQQVSKNEGFSAVQFSVLRFLGNVSNISHRYLTRDTRQVEWISETRPDRKMPRIVLLITFLTSKCNAAFISGVDPPKLPPLLPYNFNWQISPTAKQGSIPWWEMTNFSPKAFTMIVFFQKEFYPGSFLKIDN